MATTTRTTPTVLTAAAIADLAAAPLGAPGGAEHKVLWSDGTSMAGVLTVQAGRRLGAHAHRSSHHHIWVLEGRAEILGQEVGPGSYVHIPSGADHDIDASATEGCTVHYLYLHVPEG